MPEKPIAESPERLLTGRSGCTTQAAMAWPRPTPIVVGAGVEAGTGAEARQLGEADIHRAGALGAEDRVLWQPGGDVAQGPEIIGRRLVIMDLRPDLRRVL